MASPFEKAFNKFAKAGTSLNRGVNKVIGKDVFKDIKPIEQQQELPPFSSFPPYNEPAPAQWTPIQGRNRSFPLGELSIPVSENLDTCMQYYPLFVEAAEYSERQFTFRYHQCVHDFDSLLFYFNDMYNEGLIPMIKRAYSLLLPFGVFSVDYTAFEAYHRKTYRAAVRSYETMMGIEAQRNETAEAMGEQVGGAIQMQGGGFGMKGAMKGVAQAELFNFGMGMLGKFTASQAKMSQEEKAEVFSKFSPELFFKEVYNDCFNSFYSVIQMLSENGVLGAVTTKISSSAQTILENLQNPMFPQDKFLPAMVQLICENPFIPKYYDVLQGKYGETKEIQQLRAYFHV